MTFFSPVASYAETTDPATCVAPKATTAGVNVPTGSDAAMYHYDCDLSLWVSDHFTYNPATNVTLPRDPLVYTYNDVTGVWDVPVWVFVASKGAYVQQTQSVSTPPAGATTVGGPKPVSATSSPTTADTSVTPSTGTSNTGTDSTSSNTNATTGNSTNASVNNTIGSVAQSGNAIVFGNTAAGSAATGDATAMANVVNMLQSSNSAFGPGGNAVTFVSNINGDVNGDLLLDPALIGTIQPASANLNGTLTVNTANNTNQSINNTIDLSAASGDATVEANTTAGNATTGAAKAIANVVNFLNSAVASGKSFLGVININGNLNGDILMPPNFIDQLIASNVPKFTINTDLNMVNNTNQAITNNVDAAAVSGDATVDKNTSAGGAATGSASTHITAFNLTGSNVIGSNSLLVFVNVLGTWYGMIFDAPGATSAALGGGLTSLNSNTTANVDTTTNQAINNDISLAAKSGDASVSKNTKAGNAKSGNAAAAVNLLNVANSSLSLANWFGILFINVFGTWNGSFGINTAAGNAPASVATGGTLANMYSGSTSSPAPRSHLVFRFVPRSNHHSSDTAQYEVVPANTSSGGSATNSSEPSGTVLASQYVAPHNSVIPVDTSSNSVNPNFWLPALGVTFGVGMLLVERLRNLRHA